MMIYHHFLVVFALCCSFSNQPKRETMINEEKNSRHTHATPVGRTLMVRSSNFDEANQLDDYSYYLERTSQIKSRFYMICLLNHQNLVLNSKMLLDALSLPAATPNGDVDLLFFRKLVHESDVNWLIDTERKAMVYLNQLTQAKKATYKLIYTIRMRNADEQYLLLLHQLTVFDVDVHGHVNSLLLMCDVLSESAREATCQRWLMHEDTQKLYLFGKGKILSKCELRIVQLLSEGLSSKQIADLIHVSICTVNNHRKRIQDKMQTHNTAQAVIIAKKIGLI